MSTDPSSFIIILGYWLAVHDHLTNYKYLYAQEIVLKADFEKKQGLLVNLGAYKRQMRLLNERFTSMLNYLPVEHEMYGLLEDISQTGVASGLKFILFAPQSEEAHGFYAVLPIKISIAGDYFQLALFLSRIATMDRIVTFHDFSIKGGLAMCHQVACKDELVMDITAKIYRYRIN